MHEFEIQSMTCGHCASRPSAEAAGGRRDCPDAYLTGG